VKRLRLNPDYKEAEENLRVAKNKRRSISSTNAQLILVGRALHLNLDDAWQDEPLGLPVIDARGWGPRLRFSASSRLIEQFYREHATNLGRHFYFTARATFII